VYGGGGGGLIQYRTIADMVRLILEFWEEVKLHHGVVGALENGFARSLHSVVGEGGRCSFHGPEMSEEKIVLFSFVGSSDGVRPRQHYF
jgi:hypothetical protein